MPDPTAPYDAGDAAPTTSYRRTTATTPDRNNTPVDHTGHDPNLCEHAAVPTPPEEADMTELTGSDYVLAVAKQLIALGVPVDIDGADLDEEQCNLPVAGFDEIVWLRWLDDEEHGWHLDDEHGHRAAPICAPYTPPAEAARVLTQYV